MAKSKAKESSELTPQEIAELQASVAKLEAENAALSAQIKEAKNDNTFGEEETVEQLAKANKNLLTKNSDLLKQVETSLAVIKEMQGKVGVSGSKVGGAKNTPIEFKGEKYMCTIPSFRVPGKDRNMTREELADEPEIMEYLLKIKVGFLRKI